MRGQAGFEAMAASNALFASYHHMLRDQLRRFVGSEVHPHGNAWETAGATPRALLRQMGALGLFGIRDPEACGGSGLDQLASVVLAEELGRSGAVACCLNAQGPVPPAMRLQRAMQLHLQTLLSATDFASAHIRGYPFALAVVRAELTALRRDYERLWGGLIGDCLGSGADAAQIRHLRHAMLGALNWALE